MPHPVSGSSERQRRKAAELSPFHSNPQHADAMRDQNSCRRPMGDVGNIEVNLFPLSLLDGKHELSCLNKLSVVVIILTKIRLNSLKKPQL